MEEPIVVVVFVVDVDVVVVVVPPFGSWEVMKVEGVGFHVIEEEEEEGTLPIFEDKEVENEIEGFEFHVVEEEEEVAFFVPFMKRIHADPRSLPPSSSY